MIINRASSIAPNCRLCGAGAAALRHPAAVARRVPAQSGRQISHLRLRRDRTGAVLGLWRHPEPRAGGVLRPRRLLHGDVPQARGLQRREHQDPVDARHSRFHGLEPDHRAAVVLGAVQQPSVDVGRDHRGAGVLRPHRRRGDVQAPGRRRLFRDHHPGDRRHPDHPDRRPAGYTGGINGITDLRTLHGWDIRTDHAKIILYFVDVACCSAALASPSSSAPRKLGRILVAMRDKEDRVRFSGYSVANFKIFAFCVAAVFAAIGGAMFALEVGFMSPSFVGIVPSIEMVIYTAVGGRHLDPRRDLRHAAGQLRQDQPVGILSRTLAVRPRRPVHRRGAGLPGRSRRNLARLCAAAHRPDAGVAQGKAGKGWTDGSVADGAPAE